MCCSKIKRSNNYFKMNCLFVVSVEAPKKPNCVIAELLCLFIGGSAHLCMNIDCLNHSNNLAYDRYLASALSHCYPVLPQ